MCLTRFRLCVMGVAHVPPDIVQDIVMLNNIVMDKRWKFCRGTDMCLPGFQSCFMSVARHCAGQRHAEWHRYGQVCSTGGLTCA